MLNNRTSSAKQGQIRSSNPRRWLAVCLLAGALLPALVTAQTPASNAAQTPAVALVTVLKTGLMSIFEGHFFLLTLTEVGSPASASEVTIEFRDASDQRRAFTTGTLAEAHPVRLRVPPLAGTGREQLRVIVKITPLTNGTGSEPIAVLEDLDPKGFQVVPKVTCAPPSVGSGAEGQCDGWRVNHLTVEQAANSPD